MFYFDLGGLGILGWCGERDWKIEGGKGRMEGIGGRRGRRGEKKRDGGVREGVVGEGKENGEEVMLVEVGGNELRGNWEEREVEL